jgi:hypothetical protein
VPSTTAQVVSYAKNRLVSYGSFITPYQDKYHVDPSAIPFAADVRSKMDDGIASGWITDASRVYGAVRWYHRKAAGANPLAERRALDSFKRKKMSFKVMTGKPILTDVPSNLAESVHAECNIMNLRRCR